MARVIDGDTVHVYCNGRKEKLRLVGIDTPETKHPFKPIEYFGPEASARAKGLLAKGSDIWLAYGKRPRNGEKPRGKYKRVLAYIFTPDAKNFNARMVSEGYAFAMRRYPHVYMQKFINLENRAKRNKRGMWANPAKVRECINGDKAYRRLKKKCRRKLGHSGRFQWVIGQSDKKVYITRSHRSYFRTNPYVRVLFCSVEDARQRGYKPATPGMYLGPRGKYRRGRYRRSRYRRRYRRRGYRKYYRGRRNYRNYRRGRRNDRNYRRGRRDYNRGVMVIANKRNKTYQVFKRRDFRYFRDEEAAQEAGYRRSYRRRRRRGRRRRGASRTKPNCGGKQPLSGNRRSKLYRLPSQRSYRRSLRSKNVVFFCTEREARNAGYEKAKR